MSSWLLKARGNSPMCSVHQKPLCLKHIIDLTTAFLQTGTTAERVPPQQARMLGLRQAAVLGTSCWVKSLVPVAIFCHHIAYTSAQEIGAASQGAAAVWGEKHVSPGPGREKLRKSIISPSFTETIPPRKLKQTQCNELLRLPSSLLM